MPQLLIADIPDDLPDYNRGDWKHWVDTDRDCQNTRAEVLIAESLASVTFTNDRQCTAAGGSWLALFTGTVVVSASDLDVDHMVPLANAHRSGGWAWSARQKETFANDLSFDGHLIGVTSSANRSKSDQGPEDWRPPDESYWCDYAQDWISIKSTWGLTATSAEWVALSEMLATCPFEIVIEDGGTPSIQPLNTSTPTSSPGNAATPGSLFVTEIMANPSAISDDDGEWFEIYNPSSTAQVDIKGWVIRDHGTNRHLIDQGGTLTVQPLGFLVLGRNADPLSNGGVVIDYQYSGFALANSEDEIEMVDPQGTIIDVVVYDSGMVFNGSSVSLSPTAFTALENSKQGNWCASTSNLPGGDKGTPGAMNDNCP